MGRVCGVLVLIAALAGCASAHSAASRTTMKPAVSVVIYGDSLPWESSAQTAKAFGAGWADHDFSRSATAPCDWLARLPTDLVTLHPKVVTIATAGDTSYTCMTGVPAGSTEYFERYRTDLTAMFSKITATGAQVVFVEDPPFLNPTRNADVNRIIGIATQLASRYHGVTLYAGARRALSVDGRYTDYVKCYRSETPSMGCARGLIAARTLTPGLQRGLHLCPDVIVFPARCDTYSAGELRFGTATAAATTTAAAAPNSSSGDTSP